MSHPFDGIYEKLKRANENVVNLNGEIDRFLKGGMYPIIPDTHDKEWQAAVDYHRQRQVPLRFSVLSGEIIHHLRSCLDHIVWHFSSAEARRDHDTALEFPIFSEKPVTKDELRKYNRKIQGITDPKVRDQIDKLQPHHSGAGATDEPLCIVHDMDRFDKHRELAIVGGCANVAFPSGTSLNVIRCVVAYSNGEMLSAGDLAIAQRAVKSDAKTFPQVAFAKFGKRETEFVIPSLVELHNSVCDAVELFTAFV